jgi:hypothetical protein
LSCGRKTLWFAGSAGKSVFRWKKEIHWKGLSKMENSVDTRIDKIVLDLGGEKVSLTVEQVQKLRTVLNELFGQQAITVEKPYPVVFPCYPVTPWYWRYSSPTWGGSVTYSSTLGSVDVKI